MDLSQSIRAALLADSVVATALGSYEGSPAVHTRRPVPDGSGFPLIVVNPDAADEEFDGYTSIRQTIVRDVIVYGRQPADYRTVESVAYRIRSLFHRQKQSITPTGYRVINLLCSGPVPAQSDDEEFVARAVTLTVQIQPTG